MCMKALRLFTAGMLVQLGIISCVPSQHPAPQAPKPCVVSAFPEMPEVESPECHEDYVCLTVEATILISNWARAVVRYHESVAACPYVKESP